MLINLLILVYVIVFISFVYIYFIFLFACSFKLRELSISTVTYPRRHPMGFQSCPAVCFLKGVTFGTHFSRFGYIGWKPGRKFRSRIRMDGSAVCTRDTTPRTETRLSVDPHLCRVWINFVTIYLIAWFLSNVSLCLVWHWRGYPTSPTKGILVIFLIILYN